MSVRLGVNPLIWTNDDLPLLGDETPLATCLAQAAQAGFAGVEMGRKFPKTYAELGSLLETNRLVLASGWYSSRLLERDPEAEIAALAPHLELMKACDVRAVVYCEVSRCVHLDPKIPVSQRPRLVKKADWDRLCRGLDRLAEHLAGHGLAMAYHHHMGTVIQSTEDVERLMANTGDAVRLLLDTGHCAFAGGEPLDWAERWGPRIAHVHCKDVRLPVVAEARNRDCSFLDAVLDGVFTIAGDGDLAFAPLLEKLAQQGYSGWLISEAEQDPSVAPSQPLAQKSYGYLHKAAQAAGLAPVAARLPA